MTLSSYGRVKGHAPARWLTMLLLAMLILTPHLAWGQDQTSQDAERLTAQGRELRHKGDLAGAENLFKRALAIREKALGPDHPDVAQSLNSLALLYYAQGHYADAEPLLKRALAIREKALGPDDPGVAASLNNLAELYRAQRRYAEVILSRGHAHTALEWTRGVMTKLGLTVNETKTSVRDARRERFDFLGYAFGPHHALAKGKRVTLIAPPDTPHDFAYVPDIGRGVVSLVEAPDEDYGQAWHIPCAPTRTPREPLRSEAIWFS